MIFDYGLIRQHNIIKLNQKDEKRLHKSTWYYRFKLI